MYNFINRYLLINSQEDNIMEFVTEILAMVQEILNFTKEPEAAGIIEIIKNSLASIFASFPMPL